METFAFDARLLSQWGRLFVGGFATLYTASSKIRQSKTLRAPGLGTWALPLAGALKKTPTVEAVFLTGYIDIPPAFRAQMPKVPGVAHGAIEARAPAPGIFGL